MLSEEIISINHINSLCLENPKDFVEWSEREYHQKVNAAACQILANKSRVVLISGPSSSGKTTTSFKIQMELAKLGVSSHVINMDDFFVDTSTLPLRSDGKPDIESPIALDVDQIAKCLNEIVETGRTKTPKFDFATHKRKEEWVDCVLSHNDVVLMEGIHALNPQIHKNLDQSKIFKIFVYLGANFVDEKQNIVLSSRDLRLLRRLTRDERERGMPFEETFAIWDEVKKGEDAYILPYAKHANFFINSVHHFEPLLYKTVLQKEFCSNSNSIFDVFKTKLKDFETFDINLLPSNSMVREFVGNN